MTGRIKSYSAKSGFGFVASEYGDIFFHHTDTSLKHSQLRKDTQVEYDVLATPKGLVAKRMRVML